MSSGSAARVISLLERRSAVDDDQRITVESVLQATPDSVIGVDDDQLRDSLRERLFGIAGEPIRIGRFVLRRRIGSGAMGEVFSAYDQELDRKVAIKLLRPELHGTERGEAIGVRLRREARALARLEHPNVVGVYEVGEHDGRTFIAMQFVEGLTLRMWQDQRPRAWRSILDMYVAAGRGLIAAHGAGLVHRDFKPENVLVGGDGRPRVADFGLASIRERNRGEPSAADSIVGTPGYMAPEQVEGTGTDAAADQFAFCVALHEALYGFRPFEDVAVASLIAGDAVRIPRAPPDPSDVPRRIRRALVRGLRRAPRDRWPSMDHLLDALTRRSGRRSLWIALSAVAALGALGLGSGAASESSTCTSDTRRDAVWRPETKVRTRTAILSTGAPFADDTWNHVAGRIDAYVHAWGEHYHEACRAHARGHQPQAMRQRLDCLDDRLREVAALVEVLSSADAGAVERAVDASNGLASLAECNDAHALRSRPDAPPRERAYAVDAERRRLAAARARRAAGRYADGLALVESSVERAAAIGYAPLSAEAWLEHGRIEAASGQFERAQTALEQAYFAARDAGHAKVAAEAAIALVEVVGYSRGRHDAGLTWAQHARAELDKLSTPLQQARFHSVVGSVLADGGRFREARERWRRALQVHRESATIDHPQYATVLHNLGNLELVTSSGKAALHILHQALSLREKQLGPEHPMVASALNSIGAALFRLGELGEAQVVLARALSIAERGLGPRHPIVLNAIDNLAAVHATRGALDESLRWYERSLALRSGTDVAIALNNLGAVHRELGSYGLAADHFERALAIWERAYDPDHPKLVTSLVNLGLEHQRRGANESALALLRRALAIAEPKLGPRHHSVGEALAGIGAVYLAEGRAHDATAVLARALAVLEATLPESAFVTRVRRDWSSARAALATDP